MTDYRHIHRRIAELTRGPDKQGFELFYDHVHNVWLGRRDRWARLEEEGAPQIAAEGATPSEVLRKLAELLE